MKNYKAMIDISNVYAKIKHLKLKSYNIPFPIVFITAKDPDEACKSVFDNLIYIIMAQEPTIEMRLICRKIKRFSRIDKLYVL
jgi:hypothetical protein